MKRKILGIAFVLVLLGVFLFIFSKRTYLAPEQTSIEDQSLLQDDFLLSGYKLEKNDVWSAWLARTNTKGKVIWEKKLHPNENISQQKNIFFKTLPKNKDEFYAFMSKRSNAYHQHENEKNRGIELFTFQNDGKIKTQQTLLSSHFAFLPQAKRNKHNIFIIASAFPPIKEHFLARFDREGKEEVFKKFSHQEINFIHDMVVLDKEIFFLGNIYDSKKQKTLGVILKVDISGNILSRKTFENSEYYAGKFDSNNKQLIIVGKKINGTYDVNALVSSFDLELHNHWNFILEKNNSRSSSYGLHDIDLSKNKIFASGYAIEDGMSNRFFTVALNSSGKLLWKSIDGSKKASGYYDEIAKHIISHNQKIFVSGNTYKGPWQITFNHKGKRLD